MRIIRINILLMNSTPALPSDGCRNTDDRPAPALAAASQRPLPATLYVQYGSRQLFGDALEVHIQHASQLYRLRVTSLGKLILTK